MNYSRTDTTELARLRAALGGFEERLAEADKLGTIGWTLAGMDAARIAKLSHWRGEIKERLQRLLVATETRDAGAVRAALAAVSRFINELEAHR